MCQEKGAGKDEMHYWQWDKHWRRYRKLQCVILGSGESRMSSFRRTVYLGTALLAFAMGLSVGVAIPIFVWPSQQLTSRYYYSKTNSSDQRTNSNVPVVSFISNFENSYRDNSKGPVNGVFWSDSVEMLLPPGYGTHEAERWRRFIKETPVVKVQEGCGRMQNRLITFEDGTRACCRYRQNTDQIQGELFSFYLGRLLGLTNLAPSALGVVRSNDPIWARVGSQISLANWAEDRPVVLTEYIDGLESVRIPKPLRNSSRRLHPPDVTKLTSESLSELAQWSDLIIFDYLTANLDRIVNNLYNLQWNPGMMEAPAHNLAKRGLTGLLVFLDNESGLLHGYRLLDKYESYHGVLLEALCIFRKSTIDLIEKLRRDRNVGQLLANMLKEASDAEVIPSLPDKSVKILNDRFDKVHEQLSMCQRRYELTNSISDY